MLRLGALALLGAYVCVRAELVYELPSSEDPRHLPRRLDERFLRQPRDLLRAPPFLSLSALAGRLAWVLGLAFA